MAVPGFELGSKVQWPHDKSVRDLFFETAAASPDACAVTGLNDADDLSYKQLSSAVARLALQLSTESGVKRGDYVALLVDRTPEMVVAIYGVVSTGAAYVPIDPDHPADRATTMLSDCGARVLLTFARLRSRVPPAYTGQARLMGG